MVEICGVVRKIGSRADGTQYFNDATTIRQSEGAIVVRRVIEVQILIAAMPGGSHGRTPAR